MADVFNLLRKVKSLDASEKQPAYSGVVIFAGQDEEGNNIEYSAGDRSGTVLRITNEWGSQAQADAIYQKIKNHQYQPYRASGSQIDPSVEIGDAVNVSDIYGGVFSKKTTYGRYIVTDLEAPHKEEVSHEFQTNSTENRKYERFARSVRASISLNASNISAEVEDRKSADDLLRSSINVNAEAIEARVNKESGNSSSDFWWKLLSSGWDVGTGNKTVFSVKKSGAYVDGEIRASSGKIGGFDIQSNYLSYNGKVWGGTDDTGAYIGQSGIQLGNSFKVDIHGNLTATTGKIGGFDIKSNYLSYNGQTWGGSVESGAYLGQSGIQLGKNFKVDMSGNLTASNGTFGSLSVKNGNTVGTFSGSLSGCGGSLSTGISIGSTSIGTYVGNIVANNITAAKINSLFEKTDEFVAKYASISNLTCGGNKIEAKSAYIEGVGRIYYLGWG